MRALTVDAAYAQRGGGQATAADSVFTPATVPKRGARLSGVHNVKIDFSINAFHYGVFVYP